MSTQDTTSYYRTTTLAFAEYPDEEHARDYDDKKHRWTLSAFSTMPRSLRDYAKKNRKRMPDGLYTFFGKSAQHFVAEEMRYLAREDLDPPASGGFDLQIDVAFARKGIKRTSARSLIWKSPEDISAMYLGVGRTSKTTNDLLRFYSGDRFCIDRLAAEPWRIDEYAKVLELEYGPLKAVVFDAMTSIGRPAPVMRIYDPSIIESIAPLGVLTSLHVPEPPEFALPRTNWGGWEPRFKLPAEDEAEIQAFRAIPASEKERRTRLIRERADRLPVSHNPVMEEIINQRLAEA